MVFSELSRCKFDFENTNATFIEFISNFMQCRILYSYIFFV